MPDIGHNSKPAISAEARRSRRIRTFVGGKIVFRDGSVSFSCVVRDCSEHGAKIAIDASQPIPKRFYLITTKHRLAYDAEVVWRVGGSAGVKFHQVLDLVSITDPERRFLRLLSAELCARAGTEAVTPNISAQAVSDTEADDDPRWPL
jgi:hypothetical protein